MIISHKYKFIFIKPKKVAGTSVEVSLSKNCGENDILTPITKYNKKKDSDKYNYLPKNYEKLGFYNHIKPKDIRKKNRR